VSEQHEQTGKPSDLSSALAASEQARAYGELIRYLDSVFGLALRLEHCQRIRAILNNRAQPIAADAPDRPQPIEARGFCGQCEVPYTCQAVCARTQQPIPQSAEAERDALRRDHAQTGALLEAMCAAVAGQPVSDFEESFAPIRDARDLRAERDALQKERDEWESRVRLYTYDADERDALIARAETSEAARADAESSLLSAEARGRATCAWTPKDGGALWNTACGHQFAPDGDLDGFHYCYACGGTLITEWSKAVGVTEGA
jgi:hypothetical protein